MRRDVSLLAAARLQFLGNTEPLAEMCFHSKPDNREKAMTDDKSKQGSGDRSRVASGEDYEVQHYAERHGISPDEARRLIKEHGIERAKLAKWRPR